MSEKAVTCKPGVGLQQTECELRKAYYEDGAIDASEYVRKALKAMAANKPVPCGEGGTG